MLGNIMLVFELNEQYLLCELYVKDLLKDFI